MPDLSWIPVVVVSGTFGFSFLIYLAFGKRLRRRYIRKLKKILNDAD